MVTYPPMHLFCLCRELSQQQRLEEEKDRQRRKREVNAQVHERRRTTARLKQYYDKYAGRGAPHHKLYMLLCRPVNPHCHRPHRIAP